MNDKIYAMFRNSWDFQETYYRCRIPLKCENSPYGKVLYIAAMTNIAFSCEMYLKTLYYIENKKYKKGHKLNELFNSLSEELKSRIIEKMSYDKLDFQAKLISHSNAFEKWRYYHEWTKTSETIDFSFLEDFANSLFRICDEKIEK